MNKRYALPNLMLLLLCTLAQAEVTPSRLRTEMLVNPLGIDVTHPRLGWVLTSAERGQKQTAYQVVVASTGDQLTDTGDLWDSGKIASEEFVHIVYAGKPLTSKMQCFWKVRTWDTRDMPSVWSEPAKWTMGLLDKSDWGAQWITDHTSANYVMPGRVKSGAHYITVTSAAPTYNGYHSQLATKEDVTKSITFDLGAAKAVDTVILYPSHPFNYADTPGFGFPKRFHIEVGDTEDFANAKVVFDRATEDLTNPRTEPFMCKFDATTGRYIRLVVTRLGGPVLALSLAEVEVLRGGENLALQAKVTASDSLEAPAGGWSLKYLTDGRQVSDKVDTGQPAVRLRKGFNVASTVRRATVFVTARGLYELRLNGKRVGDQVFAPGWTEYDTRILYQTYDVTDLVRNGANAVAAELGVGWYAGSLGPIRTLGRRLYGPYPELLMRMEIEKTDGSTQVIVTDKSWTGTDRGPIRYSEIYDGQDEDGRLITPGWDKPDFSSKWPAVHAKELDQVELNAQMQQPIRNTQELKPTTVKTVAKYVNQFDFGQNFAGWCRIKLHGKEGQRVIVHYYEVLGPDGRGNRGNLYGARVEDKYILRGDPDSEIFEPKFTYHGFRYIEISGLEYTPSPDDVSGIVMRSDAPVVGKIESSNEVINRLMHAILWTQFSNMPSIPSDCPQRNERLGWMGDIQAFSQAGIFSMDMSTFFAKWMRDVRDAQFDNGVFTNVSPHHFLGSRNKPIIVEGVVYGPFAGAPAWADAGVTIPWDLYVNYGDKRLLEQHFDAARRWVDYMHDNNAETLLFINGRGEMYGDWMGPAMNIDLFATAFFAHDADLVARMADVLGKNVEKEKYQSLFAQIKNAIAKKYIEPNGLLTVGTPGSYSLLLSFKLYPTDRVTMAQDKLYELLKASKTPQGGIQTTHRVMLELSAAGHHDVASRIMGQHEPGSWGYMFDRGATTIWESWTGGGSQNHYALGSVGEWVWRDVIGLNPDPNAPGYKHFIVRPLLDPNTRRMNATYDSIHGPIAISWMNDADQITLEITVPPGTSADVFVPTSDPASVKEGGVPAALAKGVAPLAGASGNGFLVQSGNYVFSASYKQPKN